MKAVNRGDIYHRYFSTTNPPKNKFFVIVGENIDCYVGYFFINSNINATVARNKEMHDMQLPIKPTDYPFLTHVSFIDGHELSILKKSDLIEELNSGKARFKGHLSNEDITMLLDAALSSPLFSRKEKEYFK